jgi:AraC family transcriptional regulator
MFPKGEVSYLSRVQEMKGWRDAAERVIDYIDHHIDEPLTLSDLAVIAAYSPFHFSRIFKHQTGVSPLYYMSALRIQRAKELLLNTDLTVRDICLDVGQQSLSSFTTAFSEKVGIAPSSFRATARQSEYLRQTVAEARNTEIRTIYGSKGSVICGQLTGIERLEQGIIMVGLFSKPVPEGMPAYLQLLKKSGFFRLANIRSGTYYLLAVAVTKQMSSVDTLPDHHALFANFEEPFEVGHSMRIWEGIELAIRQKQKTDPPILISLPLLMHKYLQQFPKKAICEK